MTYKEDVTPTVIEIERLSITGNIIPPSWYQAIKTQSQKTALLAINILADIVYWYRPTILRDEETGKIISKAKKFKSDKLQRQYSQIVEFMGCSKEQAKEAVDLLVSQGLITREFRTVRTPTLILNNVMFLEPIPSAIEKITYRPSPTFSPPPRVENTPHLGEEKQGTNTDTTTQTTTQITTRTGRAKKPARNSQQMPDSFPHKFESLASTFIRETGLKCTSLSDFKMWCYGNAGGSAKGFEQYILNGITSNDIIAACVYIRKYNGQNKSNQIVLKNPNSLFTFAFNAKKKRTEGQEQPEQEDDDPGFAEALEQQRLERKNGK